MWDVRCEWRNHLMYFGGFHVKQKLEALSLEIFIFIVESTFISFLVAISTPYSLQSQVKLSALYKKSCVLFGWSEVLWCLFSLKSHIVSCLVLILDFHIRFYRGKFLTKNWFSHFPTSHAIEENHVDKCFN